MSPNCGFLEDPMPLLKLLIHTLRYLKLKQLFYQIFYRVRKPRLKKLPEPELRGAMTAWVGASFLQPATKNGKTFAFLSEIGDLSRGWNDPSYSKLWLYNLHYQDDLNAIGAENRQALGRQLIEDWILGNSPLNGNGWEPYCLSLRIVNWVKWLSRFQSSEIHSAWLRSLACQADALEQQLEFHILANHLFSNAKALVFAGSYLGGQQGNTLLFKGLRLLDEEVAEQFLTDGGHFERSPMYHAILLWDMCDLLQLQRQAGLPCLNERVDQWQTVMMHGLNWLRKMVHPDGDIAFFNDSTIGNAPTLKQLESYCLKLDINAYEVKSENLNWSVTQMKASGYITVDKSDNHRALLDVAEVGPEYQPGHAHADTLSFELSLFGQRLFVNSGTSQYGTGPMREYQRGTRAHNTVEVDDESSSEIWAGFRVARRAYPRDISVNLQDDILRVSAAHDGYLRLPGKVLVKRTWMFDSCGIRVVDELSGDYSHAISRLYCHPTIRLNQLSENEILLVLPQGQEVRFSADGASILRVVESSWHPGFGLSTPNRCIEAVLSGSKLESRIDY